MPDIEIRSATAAEAEAYRFINSTVFAYRPEGPPWTPAETTLCAFEDGAMVSAFNAWPFQWMLNGAQVAAAGIADVGTLPHRRRRGHVRRIMEESLRRQRDAGQAFAILWGTHTAIYRRFGYQVVTHDVHYEMRPGDIDFAALPGVGAPQAGGEVQLSDRPDVETLRPVYDAWIADRTGELHRSQPMWEHGALRERRGEGPIYAAVYEEGGAARGYALYTVRDGVYGPTSEERHPDESQRLTLRELVALSPAAYEALWRVVGSHDLVRRIHYDNVPEDDPLFDLVQEPRMLRRWTQDGIMARVVDVAAGLPQRPYGGPLSLRLRVIDPLCAWNDGVWSMQTDGAETTVTRSDGAPELTLPVQSLAALVTGYRGAGALVGMGRAEASAGLDLAAVDRAFATRHRPHCFHHF